MMSDTYEVLIWKSKGVRRWLPFLKFATSLMIPMPSYWYSAI